VENNQPEHQRRQCDASEGLERRRSNREGSRSDRRDEASNTQSDQRRARAQSQRPERSRERQNKPQLEPIGAPSFRFPIELKVSAYFLLPLLFGMIVLAYIMIDAHRNFQQKQMDQFARVITAQVAASAIEPLFADAKMELAVLINQVPLDNNFIGSGIFNHRGEAIAVSGIMPNRTASDLRKTKSLFPAEQFQALATNASKNVSKFDYGVVYSHPITFRGATGGFAVTVFNESSLMGHFEQMAYTLFTTTAALCLLLTTIIFFMSRHVTAPLKYIAHVAANIHNGDLTFIPERRNDELGQLIQSLNRMSKDLARKSEVENVLGRFLDPDVANKIISELDNVNFKGENVQATALFADIVGFTEMSEQMSPEEVSNLLNEYFGYYASCAKLHYGNVDKFLGDCVMIVFGAAKPDEDHQYHAVCCALLMQELTERINKKRVNQGLIPIHLRIGINSGEMLAGLLGSKDRLEYTVIGDSVNLASRLCNEANAGQIIIQEQCHDALQVKHTLSVDSHKTIKIRGKTDPVSVYNISSISQERSNANKALINDLIGQ